MIRTSTYVQRSAARGRSLAERPGRGGKRSQPMRAVNSHRITSEQLDVNVSAAGAEMSSIRHRDFGEMLWQAEPIWPSHAPNLFPIVGQLVGDKLHFEGRSYTLGRHGFARRRRFEWLEREAAGCRLLLRDDDRTREVYPFAFELEIGYAVTGAQLTIEYLIRNTGERSLPASVGGHPAFRWPLTPGGAKTAHTLEFEQPEPAPIRRLQDGLLKLEGFPTPIDGRTLHLDEALFAADAIVMDRLASGSVRYSAPGSPAIIVGWHGFKELGIWSKAGADFVCIEPWHGYASPLDFDGPFETKPGLVHLAAGAAQKFTVSIVIEAAPG